MIQSHFAAFRTLNKTSLFVNDSFLQNKLHIFVLSKIFVNTVVETRTVNMKWKGKTFIDRTSRKVLDGENKKRLHYEATDFSLFVMQQKKPEST